MGEVGRAIVRALFGRRSGRGTALLAVAVAALLGSRSPARAEVGELRLGHELGLAYLPIEVAAQRGLIEARAKELGISELKVTTRRFVGTAGLTETLRSEKIDMGGLGLPAALAFSETTKRDFKALAAMPRTAFAVYANKPEVKTVGDFEEGRRIAVPAADSLQGVLLHMTLEKSYGEGEHLRADRFMTALPDPDAFAALTNGTKVAGWFAPPPYTEPLAKDDRVHLVTTSKEILGGFEASGGALMASQRFVDANPNVALAALRGLEDANKLIREKPREAVRIFIEGERLQVSPEQLEAALTDGSLGWQVEPSGVVAIGAFMAKIHMLAEPPSSWKDMFFPLLHGREGN